MYGYLIFLQTFYFITLGLFLSKSLSKFNLSSLFQISKTHFPIFLYLIINFSLSSFFIYNNKFFSLIFIYLNIYEYMFVLRESNGNYILIKYI